MICFLLPFYSLYRTHDNFYTDLLSETQQALQEYSSFTQYRQMHTNAMQEHLTDMNQGFPDVFPGVYILVIGESQSRLHMSAYGYEKETTPWLDQMKDDPHMILFTDARSCHTHTVPVLSYALTNKNQYDNRDFSQSLTLIEAAKAAGFQTVWLSNQVRYGSWDTPISAIAAEADQQIWLNTHVGTTTATTFYDEKLVECLSKVKLTEKTLIIVHLMGNHGHYPDRYPQDFAPTDENSTIDAYDNSILYNDYVVKTLYEEAQRLPEFQGLIYCADHADDVDQNLGHDASHFTQNMTRIPFYMIFSDTYEKQHPDIFQELRVHADERFTNDLLYNTMLGIMNIVIPSEYEDNNDLSNKNYDTNKTRFRTLYGKQTLD